MMYRVRGTVAMLMTALLLGCAAPLGAPLTPPKVFSTQGYCRAAGQPLVIPDALSTALEEGSEADSETVADALLQKAALEVAHYAVSPATCEAVFASGQATFADSLARSQLALRKVGGYRASADSAIAAVQYDVTQLWREDQSARSTYVGARTDDDRGADFWAQRLATAHTTRIDAKSTRFMEELLQRIDWVDAKRFGKEVSAHAWILVQHADHKVSLQQLALSRMEPFLETGSIKLANYAYLWDRVAVNTGKLQRYGTQPTWECDDDGMLTLQPLEEPDSVNERRAAFGLNSVEEGLRQMAAGVCG